MISFSGSQARQLQSVSMIGKKDVDNIREARDQDKKEVLTLIAHCLAAHQVNIEKLILILILILSLILVRGPSLEDTSRDCSPTTPCGSAVLLSLSSWGSHQTCRQSQSRPLSSCRCSSLTRSESQSSTHNDKIISIFSFPQFRFQKFWRQILPHFDRKSPDLLEVISYYSQERRRILIMTVHGRSEQRINFRLYLIFLFRDHRRCGLYQGVRG